MSLLSQLESRRVASNSNKNNKNADAVKSHLVLGVMTGTSCDGIDLALCRFFSSSSPSSFSACSSSSSRFEIVKFETAPYPPVVLQLVRRLLSSSSPSSTLTQQRDAAGGAADDDRQRQTLGAVCELNTVYSQEIGAVIKAFLQEYESESSAKQKEDIVIASHGQTIWHITGRSTLQIGDGEVLAQVTGRVCVTNFRAADVANGGTGAPLVPYLDRTLAKMIVDASASARAKSGNQIPQRSFVVLQNFGGVGNASVFEFLSQKRQVGIDEKDGEGEETCAALSSSTTLLVERQPLASEEGLLLAAFDTGPACVVLNELVAAVSDPTSQIAQAVLRCIERQSKATSPPLMQSLFHECYPDVFSSSSSDAPLPTFDRDGCFSSLGNVDRDLLEEWLSHPYFDILPKHDKNGASGCSATKSGTTTTTTATSFHELRGRSTGREQFGASFVAKILQQQFCDDNDKNSNSVSIKSILQKFCDLCATAVEFTVESVALHIETALNIWKRSSSEDRESEELNNFIVCASGGGAAHKLIMGKLLQRLAPSKVKVLRLSEVLPLTIARDDHDVSGQVASSSSLLDDAKEAVCFALLGHEKLWALTNPELARGGGTNELAATGAHKKCFLGQVSAPF